MRLWLHTVVVVAYVLSGSVAVWAQPKLKAGFIYIGPIGDYGWTHAHEQARKIVDERFPWFETTYVESVPEGEVATFVEQMIRQGMQIIFTTSFGYMAGALTKSGKVGYVGAFPIPEVKRHIDAFALGLRAVKPQAEVHVRWIFSWFNPAAAKEATEALITAGADVFAFTEDSPTVVQVAAQHGLPSFGHYSPMHDFAAHHVVSGQLVHWEKIYDDFLRKVHSGAYTSKNLQDVDYWWLLAEGAVELGSKPGLPINPAFVEQLKAVKVKDPTEGEMSVYDLIFTRLAQMSQPTPTFDPFQGPIHDRKGTLRVTAGKRMSQQELITMEWAAPGVVGPWTNEP